MVRVIRHIHINMKEIYRSSKLLTSMTGMFVQVCVVSIYMYIYVQHKPAQ